MDTLLFSVPLTGLSEGIHKYEFACGPAFFKEMGSTDDVNADLKVDAHIINQSSRLQLKLVYNGILHLQCDRCLIAYTKPVALTESFWISFADILSIEDQIILIPVGHDRLNLSQHLYETLMLQIPLRKVPCDDENRTEVICDKNVLQSLQGVSHTDTAHTKNLEYWNTLKKLKH
jgi:uncharacterized metal-binding protein YceD (DUF177 family)